MASFTTRVELHDAIDSDYEQLHAAMKKQGFLRTIRSNEGKIYQLPTAEYNLENVTLSASQVVDKAEIAAKSTGKKYSIITTKSSERSWKYLRIVSHAF